MKIVVTARARELLKELDEAFQRSSFLTQKLADRDNPISSTEAIEVGADRLHNKAVIEGIAWRLVTELRKKSSPP